MRDKFGSLPIRRIADDRVDTVLCGEEVHACFDVLRLCFSAYDCPYVADGESVAAAGNLDAF